MDHPIKIPQSDRYLVFSGLNHYPRAAWRDFEGSAPTIEEARELVSQESEWYQIVNITKMEVVQEGSEIPE